MLRSMNRYIINFRYAVRPVKPILIYRLILTYLKIFFLKSNQLRYLDFAIDYGCNLNCEHCFTTSLERKNRRFISPEDFARVAGEAMKLGAVNFSFQGGEPTMFAKLFDYIRACQPRKNLVSVTTNGTLLNQAMLDRLKRAGVDILTVSLDSGIPEEHDRFRAVPGTFHQALGGIKLALKNGLKVTIGATLTHQSLYSEGFVKLLELAHRLKVIVFVALAAPLGRWQDSQEVLITPEDRAYLDKLLQKYPLLRTDFEANFVHFGCGAVKEILYLTPYGDVLGCPYLHFSLGNIQEVSLKEIRDRALRYNFFKDYTKACLAAEDRDFMRKMQEFDFYDPNGSLVSIEQIFGYDT